jgi:hypothetical protein
MSRPDEFYWSFPLARGEPFICSADEWRQFTDAINELRDYKDKSEYSFYTPQSGDEFEYWIFNQAVRAIDAMNPPVPVPGEVSSGDYIYASAFERLQQSLNSVPENPPPPDDTE